MTPGNTALLPLSPVHVAAVRAGDGIHISWIRRTRIDGDGWGVEVPLGEEIEAYTVEFLSGGSVVRTIASNTPLALYAAADELVDFGAVQTSLHVRVAQISATVGASSPKHLARALRVINNAFIQRGVWPNNAKKISTMGSPGRASGTR